MLFHVFVLICSPQVCHMLSAQCGVGAEEMLDFTKAMEVNSAMPCVRGCRRMSWACSLQSAKTKRWKNQQGHAVPGVAPFSMTSFARHVLTPAKKQKIPAPKRNVGVDIRPAKTP